MESFLVLFDLICVAILLAGKIFFVLGVLFLFVFCLFQFTFDLFNFLN